MASSVDSTTVARFVKIMVRLFVSVLILLVKGSKWNIEFKLDLAEPRDY